MKLCRAPASGNLYQQNLIPVSPESNLITCSLIKRFIFKTFMNGRHGYKPIDFSEYNSRLQTDVQNFTSLRSGMFCLVLKTTLANSKIEVWRNVSNSSCLLPFGCCVFPITVSLAIAACLEWCGENRGDIQSQTNHIYIHNIDKYHGVSQSKLCETTQLH